MPLPATPTKLIPTLAVADLVAARACYETIGFEHDWSWPDDGPSHAGLSFNEHVSIMLALNNGDAPSERANLYFIVDDADACHAALDERLRAGGWLEERDGRRACSMDDAANYDYGLRDFTLVDPWGHRLTFGSPLQEGHA